MLESIAPHHEEQQKMPDIQDAHVLVVDDEPISLEVVTQQLKIQHITVTKSVNGNDALEKIRNGLQPDLILLDVVMPGKDGIEVCKELRQQFSSNELPIIMLTGQDQVSDIVKGLESGANDYLTKPVSNNELMARLKTHFHIASLSKRLKKANERVEKQKQKLEIRNRFIKKTFGRYLSDEIVESILDSPQGLKLGGEKKIVTILMSDLRGFTSIGEKLEAEEVLWVLNNYLRKMTDIIYKYQGTIDEIIGDAVLVIFGAPFSKHDDACRAIACALEMQLAMNEVNSSNQQMGYPKLAMGIGLNTGEVIVGNIGSARRAKYGVIGSNVNLASRIESYTLGGQILISDKTLNACHQKLRIDKEIQVMPKGLKEPITLYDIGGIGGETSICLPLKQTLSFQRLIDACHIQFSQISCKDTGNENCDGEIIAVANKSHLISSLIIPPPLCNIKIKIYGKDGQIITDEIYAKVDDGSIPIQPGTFVAHITYMPSDVAITGSDQN